MKICLFVWNVNSKITGIPINAQTVGNNLDEGFVLISIFDTSALIATLTEDDNIKTEADARDVQRSPVTRLIQGLMKRVRLCSGKGCLKTVMPLNWNE